MSLKSAQTAKIGKKFKSIRESLGLSEVEVSSKTLINIDYIKAIESGDYTIFPARMFALRYFEKYSSFLGMKTAFFDIYDDENIIDTDDELVHKSWIEYCYPQVIIALTLVLLIIFIFKLTSELNQSNFSVKEPNKSSQTVEQNSSVISRNNEKLVVDNMPTKQLFIEAPKNQTIESELSEFIVDEGIINNLSLTFLEDSWVEIYQGSNPITYRLFKKNENFQISITPPFKIIVGNAGGIAGYYNQSEIDFTKVANALNVSSIEVKDE